MKEKQDNQPTLTPPNEWVSVDKKLPQCGVPVLIGNPHWDYPVVASYAGSGVWMDSWHQKMTFTPTCWMPLPEPPGKDNNAPTKKPNEPMTLEQLREMDGEPVYVHNLFPAKRKFEWQWALVCKERGNAEATTYTYRFLDYGKTWIAYRRPPEGEV